VDILGEGIQEDIVVDITEEDMQEDITEKDITIMAKDIIMGFMDITHIITHPPITDIMGITRIITTHIQMIVDTIQPLRRMA